MHIYIYIHTYIHIYIYIYRDAIMYPWSMQSLGSFFGNMLEQIAH